MTTPGLIKKFNELTNDEFSYLKLREVVIYVKSQKIEVHVIYPEDKKREVQENAKLIISSLKKVIDSNAAVDVVLTMSHFDLDFFKQVFIEFFSAHPSISALIDENNLSCRKERGKDFVTLRLDRYALDYVREKGIDKKLEMLLLNTYCEKINFTYEPIDTPVYDEPIDSFGSEKPLLVLENDNGRTITPENVEEFLGAIVYDKAMYVSDITGKAETAVVCGTISEWQELRRKPKDDEVEGKPFFKFAVTDFTGTVKCLIFPRQGAYEKIAMLGNGKTVVIRGDVKESTFRGETTHDIFVKDLSLCTLPSDFVENKYVRLVDDEYKFVSPKPFYEMEQVNLFGENQKKIPPYLKGKTFVIFDLEATSKFPNEAKIIEIAALKMVDGVIKESFTTFVNPKMPIPEEITQLTSITSEDVASAPAIDEALPDFYKFVEGCTLVGHNIDGYDVPLLNARGEHLHIRFLNPTQDTLPMARKHLKGLKNHKLKTLVEHFGLVNDHAHRADADTLVNAKVFEKLAEFEK